MYLTCSDVWRIIGNTMAQAKTTLKRRRSVQNEQRPTVHLKMPAELLADIESAARREGADRPNMIRILIRRGLAFSFPDPPRP